MRIGVLEKHQKPTEDPKRHISKGRAQKFIQRKIAAWLITGKLLKMLKDDAEIRGDADYLQTHLPVVQRPKRKRWKENLLLFYPHKDQESHGILRRCRAQ